MRKQIVLEAVAHGSGSLRVGCPRRALEVLWGLGSKDVTRAAKLGMCGGLEVQGSQLVLHWVSHGWWGNSRRTEEPGQGCPGAREAGLEAGRGDEQMGERLGLLTWADFSSFSTKARPDMEWGGSGGCGRKYHHLLSHSLVGFL